MCIGYFSKSLLRVNARLFRRSESQSEYQPEFQSDRYDYQPDIHYGYISNNRSISFILDTGAEATILDPTDAIWLGIEIESLEKNIESISGIDRNIPTFILPDVKIELITMIDGNLERHIEPMDRVLVGDPEHYWDNSDKNSILGNDLWTRFDIATDLECKKFTMTRIPTRKPDYWLV